MILAIVAIVVFQSYWLYKNYQEEKQALRVQTNILFREAVYQSQARKMKIDTTKLDSSVNVRHRAGSIRMISSLQNRLRDTLRANVSFNSRIPMKERQRYPFFKDSFVHARIDSGKVRKLFTRSGTGQNKLIEFLETAESLQDSLTVKEVEYEYRRLLAVEKIQLRFTITKHAGTWGEEFMPPDLAEANEVTIGFMKPVTFRVNIQNTTGYIFRKMSPMILVSVLLVGLTVLSFVLLYRNLIRQKRLTQLKNDFISNITHELKTPIATVSVAVEAMKNFNVLDDPKRTQEYLSISANELQRLALLVDNVLRLSMFEKKEVQFKKEPFDIGELVVEVMESMKLQFETQRAQTSIEYTGENFIIEGDKRHIASVIYNLLDNALKYSNDNPVIKLHLLDRSSFFELRVSDNGIGISDEYKDKVFEQFFRVPSGDRPNIKGYGLGLSYVNHIIRSHQGFIELQTQVGKGSTFCIKLPFSEAAVVRYDHGRVVRKISFKL